MTDPERPRRRSHLRWLLKGMLFAIGALVLLVGLAVGALLWVATPPSDRSLERRYEEYESRFALLVSMAEKDQLDGGFCTRGARNGRNTLTSQRRDEYFALLREIGAGCICRDSGTVDIRAWAFGLPGTLTAKGWVFSEAPLKPIAEDIDKVPRTRSREIFYKPIAGNWYLYRW